VKERFTGRRLDWRVVAGLAACVVAGMLCQAAGTPLPWMIGPLLAMAALRFSGAEVTAPRGGREAGQVIIATALGLYFTPTVAQEVLGRWELLVAAALFATALAYIGAYSISRLTDTDRTTAFFASVPGGATEMAILGGAVRGKARPHCAGAVPSNPAGRRGGSLRIHIHWCSWKRCRDPGEQVRG